MSTQEPAGLVQSIADRKLTWQSVTIAWASWLQPGVLGEVETGYFRATGVWKRDIGRWYVSVGIGVRNGVGGSPSFF